jgi:Zn-dependent M28 family amino/carboxypeptidase
MNYPRLLRAAIVVIAIGAFVIISGELEMKRISTPLPFAAATDPAAPVVDTAVLLNDLRELSAPRFQGRKMGTEGSRLAQAWVQGRFAALGLKKYGASYVQPFTFTRTSIKGLLTPGKSGKIVSPQAANIVGFIPGSVHPERVIVVSAHYDHLGTRDGTLYPGADDNASGVGAMLAIAAHFKANPPRNTIVFAAFDAEEQGLYGAKAFLANLPFPRKQLLLNLNLDMVGHNDRNEIFAAGTSYTPSLKPLLEQATRRSTVHVKLGHDRSFLRAPAIDNWTDSSDHGPFHDAGVPFLYFGVDDHPDYHAPTDTYEKVNKDFYGRVAALIVDVAVVLDKSADAYMKR